ncbi:MAG: hypothetical protein WC781_00200 [Candidatus Pacearchaeota archaeon]|jgi:hypothetical protein
MARDNFLEEEHEGLLAYLTESDKNGGKAEVFENLGNYVRARENDRLYSQVIFPLGRVDNTTKEFLVELTDYLENHIPNVYEIHLTPERFCSKEGPVKSHGDLIVHLDTTRQVN